MNNNYDTTYNEIYNDYKNRSDCILIDLWKYHQHHSQRKDDFDWIAFSVCEDLLRQRENIYLDVTYPKD